MGVSTLADSTGSGARIPAAAIDQFRCLVGCAFGLSTTISAAFLLPFSVLARPMAEEFGWSRGALFIAYSICGVGGVLLTPVAGYALDRFGARLVALSSALTMPFAIALMAFVPPNYSIFLSTVILVGIASAPAHTPTYLYVVARFFDGRLGLAIAVAMGGLALSQATAVIFVQHMLNTFGWRGAWIATAAAIAILGSLALIIVPWKRVPKLARTKTEAFSRAAAVRLVVRAPLFWTLAAALTLVLMVSAGITLNLVGALQDQGISGMGAASIAALVPMFALVGRLVTGALIDRLSYVAVGATFFAGQAVGCFILATMDSMASIYVAVALIGLGYGADSDLTPYVVRRCFSIAVFGSLVGLMAGIVQIGSMVGPVLAASVFDQYGGYRPAFFGFACASTIASVLWIVAGRLRVSAQGAHQMRE